MAATAGPIQVEEVAKTDAYRLIVFNRAGTAALLKASPSGYDLPLLEIPKFTRSAEEITTFLRDRWHMPSVLLFSGLMNQNPIPLYFAALEAQFRTCALPERIDWFPVHHALSHLLEDTEHNVLESAYFKSTNRMAGDDPEPFGRLGWFSNLQDWVRTVIQPLGMELKDFQQLNGCETFSLIRFDTTQAPVWFKAVGKPNLHECPITITLARLFPECAPSILALHPTYQGWLMADAGGTSLNESEDYSAWESAVAALAELQLQSIGKSSDLLEAGCRDLRITKLLDLVDRFLDVMADLMKQQTKVPPPILSREELAHLGEILKHALLCLEALQFPDTLGHSDFNPGNILVGPERSTFIDWAEAHVSHPFLTFEYLISHLKKDYPALGRFEETIRSCYSQRWRAVSSPKQVFEAFLFTPLVAVFAYAVAGDAWRDQERLTIPHVPGFLRSLTRRMKQEADSIQRRRVGCRS
jgi:Phosphotransferase enzyme family